MPISRSELKPSQKVKYYLGNLAMRGLLMTVGVLPYGIRLRLMGRIMQGLSPVLGIEKRIRNNLNEVCPELEAGDVQSLCNQVCDNVGRTIVELYAGEPFWKRARAAEISGPGLDALRAAKAAGRPVLLVTAHFGNYDAARAKLISLGFPMGSLYRRMANPYFNTHYVAAMKATGTPMFEQGKRGMVEMVRYLKQGGTLAIVTDLHAHGGTNIDYFGKPAVTSLVPAELALKYNAAMIPVYAVRLENGVDFKVIMNDEIQPSDPLTMTTQATNDLEQLVRQHMGQWFWIHRRWKKYAP